MSKSKPHVNWKTPSKMTTITVTMQEIWMHTTPKVFKNKKKYSHKLKHKK